MVAESVVAEAKATAPGGGSGPESRMRVGVGLTLLLCAVLLGTASANSGQYPPPCSGGQEPPPPPASTQGRALGAPTGGFTPVWSQPAPTFAHCHSLGFGSPALEGVFGELERGVEEGAVTVPTPLLA